MLDFFLIFLFNHKLFVTSEEYNNLKLKVCDYFTSHIKFDDDVKFTEMNALNIESAANNNN